MPVNEVVVKGFFPPFFAAALARGQDINLSPRGGCGVPPGGGGVRSTCRVYPWIDRHCEKKGEIWIVVKGQIGKGQK